MEEHTVPSVRLVRDPEGSCCFGGDPRLPADVEWPTINKRPAVYLAQFCFRDSIDLVGDLPGDVLLGISTSGNSDSGTARNSPFGPCRIGIGSPQ